MIDKNLLKSLGWTDELVRAAEDVARSVESSAVLSSLSGTEVTTNMAAAATEASQEVDTGGPPIAFGDLRFGQI